MDPRSTLQSYFKHVDNGDVEAALKSFTSDTRYERPGYAVIVGMPALRSFYESVRVISEGTHKIEEIVIDGRSGAAWGTFTGTHRDGTPINETWSDVYRFDADGRIKFRRSHFFRPAV